MKNIIKFTNTLGVSNDYKPKPASKVIPEWYKDLQNYIHDEKKPNGNAGTTATAKKCMPIFDAISSGYIISTHTDLYISQIINDAGVSYPYFEWASSDAIKFHVKSQLPEHPNDTGHPYDYPKWHNTWGIETPRGYSCLFIPPMHRETPITILPGIVDTDSYKLPVEFPFVLKNPKMEGLIPAGTPIVQIIPFKRDNWQTQLGGEKELKEQNEILKKLRSVFFDGYKMQHRQKKEYV